MTPPIQPQDPPSNEPPRYSLRLLGSPAIAAQDGRALPGLGPGKSLAMLAYIAVRGRSRRDELISILWGEIPEEKARNAFRQSLHRLRTALGDEVLPQHRDDVAIAPNCGLATDRDVFVAAFEDGRWDDAIAAYGGEFLEAFEVGESAFDRWADAERVRLRSHFEEALLAAGEQAVASGRIRDAIQLAERLTTMAPFDGEAAVFQVNTLVTAGRHANALAAAKAYAARLKEELDLPVPSNIRAIIERLERRNPKDTPRAQAEVAANGRKVATFVGRESEISRMLARLTRLRSEKGATVLVEGDPGMGKSRLFDEFADRVRSLGGVQVLRGHEATTGGALPYASIAEALRPLVRASGISGASRHLLAEAARLLPELRDSFDLPNAPAVEDEAGRIRFFEGIAALTDAAAYERPLCVLLDDAQHASSSTLDLLTYLSHRLHDSPILFVVAYSPDRSAQQTIERLRELATVDEQSPDTRIELGPLSHDETTTLVREQLPEATRTAVDVERIAHASRGVPVTAIELARRAAAGQGASDLPASMRDMLWARLQGASPSQRRVFFAASLFERTASLRLLAAAAHLPESATFDAVEDLTRVGLLRAISDGYVVSHDSTTSFLVDGSGLAGRALLAGWAGDALAAEPDCTDSELAALYAVAGRSREAFAHARKAAFTAASMGASPEVVRLLGIALTFAPNAAARQDIDALLVAFGGGRLALPSPEEAAAAPAVETVEASEPDVVVEPLDLPAQTAEPSTSATAHIPFAVRKRATRAQWARAIAISIVVFLAGMAFRRAVTTRMAAGSVADTLIVSERDARGQNQLRADVGALRGASVLVPIPTNAAGLQWIDSLGAPWLAPIVAPDRQRVALERVTTRGREVYVLSADRHDTLIIAAGPGDNTALAWSPDSRSLLVSRSRTLDDGSFDTDLFRASIDQRNVLVPIDTSASRTVTEARWSPTGLWVAWVARSTSGRQRDVFVSRPDGSEQRNLSANPADDYNINWSPDGSMLVFTSTRNGGPRLYVYDFDNARLWPVSDRNGDDGAVFSPDGRMLAFQSVRDGDLGIYVRPTLGGSPRRVTPPGRQFGIARWDGAARVYIDRVRVLGSAALGVGDTVRLTAFTVSVAGALVSGTIADWKVLDPGIIALSDSAPGTGNTAGLKVVGRAVGNVRVVALLPGWRADTLTLAVTSTERLHITDEFIGSTVSAQWLPLGAPLPYVGVIAGSAKRAVYPNGDMEWESGVLLRPGLELRSGLHVRARLFAPFSGRPSAATATMALVPLADVTAIDRAAPRFAPMAAVSWDGAAGVLMYSVGQQTSSEPVSLFRPADSHTVEITIGGDQVVTFSVDGQVRWRSSLKFLGDEMATPAQLWLGGRATGSTVALSDLLVELPGRAVRR